MGWHNFNITWSKEFKDFAVYSMMNTDIAEQASEWLFHLYCSHESMFEQSWAPFDHDPTEAELEVYQKFLSALIKKSKELKVVRKWFKHLKEQTGHDYMKDFRKRMRKDYGVIIE